MIRFFATLLLGLAISWPARASPSAPLRRFVLAVAANEGGRGRDRLRYAEGDARALVEVLQQLGGVESSDARSLVQPTAATLQAAFAELAARVREAERGGVRTEVVFYYSGHSDEQALLLAGERVEYATLRRMLEELPAQVRIAILDSCASGAFTRSKGGVARPPFIVDTSTDVRGHAFLTSSSASEAAQESDRIGASFFTHYLVSGLRGAADASGDRKITLTEAYRFAFDETLARTAPTQFGSQHPAYEIRLAGTGDLVMTDLRSTRAEVVLDESVAGRVFVWEVPRKLAVEVDKVPGRKLVLALPPREYQMELARETRFFAARVQALADRTTIVNAAAFHSVAREATLARGVVEQFVVQPFGASVTPPFSTGDRLRTRTQRPVLHNLAVALLYDDPDAVAGVQLGLFGVAARRYLQGAQLAVFFDDAGELFGAQLSALTNVTRSYGAGLQLSLASNFVGHELSGVQLTGGLNYGLRLRGAQLAFGLNVAREHLVGLQTATLNWAHRLDGAQIGGINAAHTMRGLQLGAINVASGRVRGAQIGLINYADEANFSFGALAMTRQGGTHAQLSVDELLLPELALRFDAKFNYSFVSLGLAPYRQQTRGYAVGAGLGGKAPLPLPDAWIDVDLGFHMLQPTWDFKRGVPNSLYRLRVLARYDLRRHLSIFAGLTLNVYLELQRDERYRPHTLVRTHVMTDEHTKVRALLWPGFAAGMRL